jgi:hypothetical protein
MASKSYSAGVEKPVNTPSLLYYYENLHWFHLIAHIVIPAVPILCGPFVSLSLNTALLGFVLYWMGSVSLTTGQFGSHMGCL